jgi:L1 cell adhesion molecule like protein
MTHDPPPIPDEQTPKSVQSNDDIYSYNCALLENCLFFMNFLEAVKEGDGSRIVRQYKYLLLLCKADGQQSSKYALECLYQTFLTESILSPRASERFVWNRSVNASGGVLGQEYTSGFGCRTQ